MRFSRLWKAIRVSVPGATQDTHEVSAPARPGLAGYFFEGARGALASRLGRSITSWVQGGLGNQLFQLNAALNASRQRGAPALVSRASYWRDRLRGFDLDPLMQTGELTSRLEDIAIGPPYSRSGGLRTSTQIMNLPIVETLSCPTIPQVLVGFFQDQASLAFGTDLLLTRLRALEISHEYFALKNLIEGRPVAHVRRGDYITSSAARAMFGTLSVRYYHESMEQLGYQIKDAVFFSDDAEYVEDVLGVAPDLIIGPSTVKSSLQNLLLMSSGSALVMPNSSFSWWAAELLAGRGEVVAPRTWFYDREDSLSPMRAHWFRNDNV